jgi:beta-N-acetylhexosaminidase
MTAGTVEELPGLGGLVSRSALAGVMVRGRSSAGVAAVRAAVRKVTAGAVGAPLLVATDQEGGEVQDLNGPGFSGMPTALYQGRQMAASVLQADAERWGGQLRRAGVNVNFAPVGDVVPASVGTANQPIGRWYREYGYEPVHVAHRVVTVITGMRAAGIATTVKHFPGLGRATGNTDVSTGVTDPTTPTDPYLAPFRAAIAAHVPFVMVSTATYPNIAPHHRAAFSHHVVTWLLRQQLGFRGLVVSDSLTTVAVQDVLPGDRAVRFLAAGGDLVLVTSAAPVASMLEAIHAAAVASPAFHAQVRAAVLAVLTAKAAAGLIPG